MNCPRSHDPLRFFPSPWVSAGELLKSLLLMEPQATIFFPNLVSSSQALTSLLFFGGEGPTSPVILGCLS